jgi:predicted hotdog family 3-hydroxylacyl-ACP dehydratase
VIAGREEIEALIPHAGRMCLLHAVLAWDGDHIRCLANSHRAADNPMRIDGELAGICGVEYAAQAMALHGRLALQEQTSSAGYLMSVRDVVCHVARMDEFDGDLVIEARRLMGDADGAVYGFSVSAGNALLLEGRAAVILQGQA